MNKLFILAMISLGVSGCSEIVSIPLHEAVSKRVNSSSRIDVDKTKDFSSLDVEERRKEREIDKKILVLSKEDLRDKVSSCRKILSGRELSAHTFKERPEEKDKIIKNLKKLSIKVGANVVVVMKMEINAINYDQSNCMFS